MTKEQDWRNKTKEIMIDAFGGSCGLCGYNKCCGALHFHHVNKDEKEFSFSKTLFLKWEVIINELRKCVLLCANCHAEVHYSGVNISDDVPRFNELYADKNNNEVRSRFTSCETCGKPTPSMRHKFCEAC